MPRTSVPQVSSSADVDKLLASLEAWCAQTWDQMPDAITVLERRQRAYSTIWRVDVLVDSQLRQLICKQTVEHQTNQTYRAWGHATASEFAALTQAEEAFAGSAEHGVPRAFGVAGDGDVLIMEAVAGHSLDDFLAVARWTASAARVATARRHFFRLGCWLSHYQQAMPRQISDTAPLTRIRQQSEERLERIGERRDPLVPRDVSRRVLESLDKLCTAVAGPIELVACHGDFGPWNVLVTHETCVVVDFFCARHDCRWLDALSVISYLDAQRHSWGFCARRIASLQQAFLEGFGVPLPKQCLVFRACAIYQTLCRLEDAVCSESVRWTKSLRRARRIRDLVAQLVARDPDGLTDRKDAG